MAHQIDCHGQIFQVEEGLINFIFGESIKAQLVQHFEDNEDEPYPLNNQDVRPKDFESMIEFAKLAAQHGTPRIDKPIESTRVEEWLSDGRHY